jgi:signal transduction histidine kinase
MNRVGETWATSGLRAWRLARCIASLACTILPGVAFAQQETSDAASTTLLTVSILVLAITLALLVGIVMALRAARSRQRLIEELRDERTRAQCLEPLLDVWLWQSDRDHRIVSLRPPHGAVSSDWSAPNTAVPLWELFKVDDEAALRSKLQNAAPLEDIQVQRSTPQGMPRRAMLRARSRTDAAGGFAGYHGTLRDLSVVAASSVSAMDATPAVAAAAAPPDTADSDHESFSFTVSHDLRAPIRVVEGFTKIVKEDYGRLLDRVGNDHLDRVLAAAARMNNMIDALLALSKLSSQPLARQPVNLSQLAGYVADDLRRQWPDRVVQIEIEPNMHVQGDPTLLRAVVENLLGNAWKYTGKAAQPNIGFSRHAQDVDSFTVHDNGAGFDMRFSDRLFGVFQRLHSANDFPGTGVGLASVRRIVRRHGGEIWGEAEVNRGARFHFSLPQSSDPR